MTRNKVLALRRNTELKFRNNKWIKRGKLNGFHVNGFGGWSVTKFITYATYQCYLVSRLFFFFDLYYSHSHSITVLALSLSSISPSTSIEVSNPSFNWFQNRWWPRINWYAVYCHTLNHRFHQLNPSSYGKKRSFPSWQLVFLSCLQ
jgi:hypothetical protein